MPNNTSNNISNLDHAPAQKVGGMRVKEPHARRTSLTNKEEESKDASVMKNEEGREMDEEQDNMEEEKMRVRELQERQARDMQNHEASKQPLSKNPGSNVNQMYIPNAQPRSMNH